MKTLTGIVFAAILALNASVAFAETFDAVKNYTCDQGSAGVWYYEAYKAEVGTYREMDFGHAPVREVSKYGVDAHYVVDGDQPLYPFIMSTPEYLLGSPATGGTTRSWPGPPRKARRWWSPATSGSWATSGET
jgi:hypothetical protein